MRRTIGAVGLTEDAKPASRGPEALGAEERASADALLAGSLVGVATETVWGALARFDRRGPVQLVYRRKGREAGKPLQLLCADAEAALAHAAPEDRAVLLRLVRFWPGPLTAVVNAAADLPDWMVSGGRVGLRVPDEDSLRALLGVLPGRAAAATSLNFAGGQPARTREDAERYLGSLVDRVHPGGTSAGLASTVFLVGERRLLRAGAIAEQALAAALDDDAG